MFRKTTTESFPGRAAQRAAPLSRHPRFAARRTRIRKMRRLLSLRRRLSCKLHLHRSCRKYRRQSYFCGRALCQGLQHRLLALHFLRLLRRGLPHRRHHPRPQHRASPLRHQRPDLSQRTALRVLAPPRRQNLALSLRTRPRLHPKSPQNSAAAPPKVSPKTRARRRRKPHRNFARTPLRSVPLRSPDNITHTANLQPSIVPA